jgi:hypothetical protein
MGQNLYQLYSRCKLLPNTYFAINGPYDTHGYVIKYIRKDKKLIVPYLHLIRGITNQEYENKFH